MSVLRLLRDALLVAIVLALSIPIVIVTFLYEGALWLATALWSPRR